MALVERLQAVLSQIKTEIRSKVNKSGDVLTGKLTTKASDAASASLNVPAGAVPTAPAAGDVFFTGTAFKYVNNAAQVTTFVDSNNLLNTLGYTPVQQGTGVGQTTNPVKIGWSVAAKLKVTVDSTDLGNVALEPWVSQQIANLVASSPATLDTLNELATALGDDPNFATTMTNALAGKASLSGASFTGQVWVTNTVEAQLGTITTGKSPFYLYSNIGGYGLYSAEGGTLVGYDRATSKHYLANIDVSTIVKNDGAAYDINVTGHADSLVPGYNYQVNSLGVGTAASGSAGDIRATGDIQGFFSSDKRLKENIRNIENPLELISRINGVRFDWTASYIEEAGGVDDYFVKKEDVGVIAQEIEAILPEIVSTRKDGTKAVKYDRLVALLIESTKELHKEVDYLKERLCKIEEAE